MFMLQVYMPKWTGLAVFCISCNICWKASHGSGASVIHVHLVKIEVKESYVGGEVGINGCKEAYFSAAQTCSWCYCKQDEYVNFALNIFLCPLISHS